MLRSDDLLTQFWSLAFVTKVVHEALPCLPTFGSLLIGNFDPFATTVENCVASRHWLLLYLILDLVRIITYDNISSKKTRQYLIHHLILIPILYNTLDYHFVAFSIYLLYEMSTIYLDIVMIVNIVFPQLATLLVIPFVVSFFMIRIYIGNIAFLKILFTYNHPFSEIEITTVRLCLLTLQSLNHFWMWKIIRKFQKT